MSKTEIALYSGVAIVRSHGVGMISRAVLRSFGFWYLSLLRTSKAAVVLLPIAFSHLNSRTLPRRVHVQAWVVSSSEALDRRALRFQGRANS